MNLVDEASGDTLARMGSEETIWAAAGVLRAWVKKYGIPVALYTDWKNVYVLEASTKEQLQGVVPVTQFGQMCQRLGIRIIAANSPQAKGRVERNHGTHQDRLVKKMRLKKIQTHAEANRFLEKEYLPEHNRRFRRTPARPEVDGECGVFDLKLVADSADIDENGNVRAWTVTARDVYCGPSARVGAGGCNMNVYGWVKQKRISQ
jgi:hypothetical protein